MKTRIISGVMLIIVMGLLMYFGGIPMAVVFCICSCIGFLELTKATRVAGEDSKIEFNKDEKRKLNILDIIGCIGAVAYYIVGYLRLPAEFLMGCTILVLILFMLIYVFTFPRFSADRILKTFFSFFYAVVIFSYFYLTREFKGIFDTEHFNTGFYAGIMILISAWVSDTGAYFTGVCIGKHKAFPVLSPKKTIEGCVGGIVFSGIVGSLYGLLLNNFDVCSSKYILYFGILCMIGSVFGQIGDLAASAIKRNYQIKDYGKLIPGHGGIMDRFDSVILISPLVYFICLVLLSI